MVYSVLLQVEAAFVQIADFPKFFLRFCCSKLRLTRAKTVKEKSPVINDPV